MTQLSVRRMPRGFEPLGDLDRWFEDALPGWFGPTIQSLPVDISEDDEAYTIEADVPGLRREDLELTLERNKLTLGVNATTEQAGDERRFLRRERARVHATRTIRFPHAIDADAVVASLDQGVLRITAPKAATDKARRIDIA